MKKKCLLIVFNIVFIFFSHSQITVRNNAFVYATDIVVFVNDNVNIQESTAKFYLRDEAQLIQGTGTNGNSGIGHLSVYQWGTVNQFAYNYWCSPVGNVLANTVGNSSFKPNNNIYDFNSAPITSSPAAFTSSYNGTSNPLTIAKSWIWGYDPGTQYSEWDLISDSGELSAGYGFTMKGTSGSGDNQMYDFRGKPNSGNIATSVLSGQQTLVGNPYPSAMDARDYIWDTDNQNAITGNLYYWEQAPGASSHYLEDYIGGYATYTINSSGTVESFTPALFTSYLPNGTPTNLPAGNGNKIAKRYIPIGQGFMVEGKTGTTGTAFAKNSFRDFVKESSGTSYFFRNENIENNTSNIDEISYDENGLNIVPSDFKRFRVNIDFDETYTRQLLMNFHSTATEGFDYGLEGKSPDVISSDAHWLVNNEPFVIQALNFNQELNIPIVVNVNNQQLVRFRIFDIQNFDDAQPIYLHDMIANTYTNLREQNFELILNTGNYSNRFEITFDSESLSVGESVLNSIIVFQNNSQSELTIKNPNFLNIAQVSLYDITGKVIFNEIDLKQNQEYRFSTKKLSSGTYIANITLDTNQTISKKIIIAN